jgi:N-acetylglutamate synthase-like GNAT family acetyltransferase
MSAEAPALTAIPLAAWERDALAVALSKAGLPTDDVRDRGPLFWRYNNREDLPAGFGGMEVYGDLALLRSIVVLPVVRQHGFGDAIVATLENAARAKGCKSVWLFTTTARRYFERLGYSVRAFDDVPDPIKGSRQFKLCQDGQAMMKTLSAPPPAEPA